MRSFDRPAQPAPPAAGGRIADAAGGELGRLDLGAPQRPAGVDQQLLGLGRGLLGQPGQLAGDPPHHRLRLVAGLRGAQPQLRPDLTGPPTGRAAAVTHLGAGRAAGGLHPTPGRGDAPHRLGQQPGVGRVGHIGRDDGGVRAQPRGAQQLRLGGLGQQRLVAPVYRRGAAAGGELHQRGRVRHPPVQRDPAEPPPSDRIGHLAAQGLVAQPVAGTSGTSAAGRPPSAWTAGPTAGRRTARTGRRTPDRPTTRRPEPARPAAAAPRRGAPPPTSSPQPLASAASGPVSPAHRPTRHSSVHSNVITEGAPEHLGRSGR